MNRRATLNRKIISLVAAAALGVSAPTAIALAQASAHKAAPARTTAGPTVAASTAGIRPSAAASATRAPAPAADTRLGAGRNVALMVVGGAALIIGAVIGGAPGVIIAVIGAAVGLYGLYNFVQ